MTKKEFELETQHLKTLVENAENRLKEVPPSNLYAKQQKWWDWYEKLVMLDNHLAWGHGNGYC